MSKEVIRRLESEIPEAANECYVKPFPLRLSLLHLE